MQRTKVKVSLENSGTVFPQHGACSHPHHDNSKHATKALVTLAQEVQNYQNKTQLMQCVRHEIFSFLQGQFYLAGFLLYF